MAILADATSNASCKGQFHVSEVHKLPCTHLPSQRCSWRNVSSET